MKYEGKVFIDANIIIYAETFEKEDVFDWINQLYDEIYIHKEVLDELLIPALKQKINNFIEKGHWILFDPNKDDSIQNEGMYELYLAYLEQVKKGFFQLDKKKELAGRDKKNTTDIGEIHSMAAAMLISARIICSNDYDIREVIEDTPIIIAPEDEEADSYLLEQHTLEDFCISVCSYGIAKKSSVRKFYKAINPTNNGEFDNLMQSIEIKE